MEEIVGSESVVSAGVLKKGLVTGSVFRKKAATARRKQGSKWVLNILIHLKQAFNVAAIYQRVLKYH